MSSWMKPLQLAKYIEDAISQTQPRVCRYGTFDEEGTDSIGYDGEFNLHKLAECLMDQLDIKVKTEDDGVAL